MKANYKGIELDGTPQEILLFIHLMEGPQALQNSSSLTSDKRDKNRFMSEMSLAYHQVDKKKRIGLQDAAERYISNSF